MGVEDERLRRRRRRARRCGCGRRSRPRSQTLPSPILSVRAALMMASTAPSAPASSTSTSMRVLGVKVAVLGAAVGLTVAALAAEALDLGDGHALDADLGEGGLHVLQLEGLDNGGDELHEDSSGRALCPVRIDTQHSGRLYVSMFSSESCQIFLQGGYIPKSRPCICNLY